MKSMKVADDVHAGLQDIQRPRESLSEVIKRLLETHKDVVTLLKRV